ncbi:MAG: hypothetical protein ABW179_03015 [Methylobacterium sp.]
MKLSQIAKPLGFIAIAAIPAGSNLLLTLVLLRGLGIDGFAFWSLIEPMMMIFGTVGALGIQYGLLFTTASGASEPRHGLGAAFTLAAPLSLILASVVWLASRQWLGPVGYLSLVLPLVAETLAMLAISSLRGQRRTGAWILFEMIRSLGLVAIAFLALWLDLSWVRSVDSFLILRGTFTMAAVVTVAFVLKARLGVDRALMMRMIRYGLPIAGAAMVANMTTSADRFIMATLDVDLSVIASYAAHQRLTGIMGVLTVTPLNLWFAVEAMRRDTVAEAGFFQAVVIILLLALSTLMLGAFLLAPFLWPWLFPGLEFHPFVFCVLTLTIVPQALGIVLNIGGLREKKTHLNAIVVACGTTAMVALGFPLIHFAAAAGAALARLGTYVVTATAGRTLSQRISPVHHEVVPLLPVLGAIAAAIGSLFYGEMGLPIWLMPVLTVVLVLFVLRRESVRLRQLLGQRAAAGNDGAQD